VSLPVRDLPGVGRLRRTARRRAEDTPACWSVSTRLSLALGVRSTHRESDGGGSSRSDDGENLNRSFSGARHLVMTPVSHTGSGEFDPLAPHRGFDSHEVTPASADAPCGSPVGLLRSTSDRAFPSGVLKHLAGARSRERFALL